MSLLCHLFAAAKAFATVAIPCKVIRVRELERATIALASLCLQQVRKLQKYRYNLCFFWLRIAWTYD